MQPTIRLGTAWMLGLRSEPQPPHACVCQVETRSKPIALVRLGLNPASLRVLGTESEVLAGSASISRSDFRPGQVQGLGPGPCQCSEVSEAGSLSKFRVNVQGPGLTFALHSLRGPRVGVPGLGACLCPGWMSRMGSASVSRSRSAAHRHGRRRPHAPQLAAGQAVSSPIEGEQRARPQGQESRAAGRCFVPVFARPSRAHTILTKED